MIMWLSSNNIGNTTESAIELVEYNSFRHQNLIYSNRSGMRKKLNLLRKIR